MAQALGGGPTNSLPSCPIGKEEVGASLKKRADGVLNTGPGAAGSGVWTGAGLGSAIKTPIGAVIPILARFCSLRLEKKLNGIIDRKELP